DLRTDCLRLALLLRSLNRPKALLDRIRLIELQGVRITRHNPERLSQCSQRPLGIRFQRVGDGLCLGEPLTHLSDLLRLAGVIRLTHEPALQLLQGDLLLNAANLDGVEMRGLLAPHRLPPGTSDWHSCSARNGSVGRACGSSLKGLTRLDAYGFHDLRASSLDFHMCCSPRV